MSQHESFPHLEPARSDDEEGRAGAKPPTRGRKPTGDYAVGYARPPETTRFKRGQSGNPRGRPRKAKPKGDELARDVLGKIFNEPVTVRQGGQDISILGLEVILRGLFARAAKGDVRAANTLIDYAMRSGVLTLERRSDGSAQHGVLVVRQPCVSAEQWEEQYGPGKLLQYQEEMRKQWEDKHGPASSQGRRR